MTSLFEFLLAIIMDNSKSAIIEQLDYQVEQQSGLTNNYMITFFYQIYFRC